MRITHRFSGIETCQSKGLDLPYSISKSKFFIFKYRLMILINYRELNDECCANAFLSLK